MRSLTLGAALLLASAGAASACVQGDVDCENAMGLGHQIHRHLVLPDAPDEQSLTAPGATTPSYEQSVEQEVSR